MSDKKLNEMIGEIGDEGFEDIFKEDDVYAVDDAPDVGDIDDLLGLSGDRDDTDIEMEDDTEPVDYPHFRISTKKLKDALKLSSNISQGTGKDKISRSVGLEAKDGILTIYLTDSEVFAEKIIPLMNEDNVLTDFIGVSHAVVSKAIKVCPASTVIYKKDGKYYMKLVGGDLEIDKVDIEKKDMQLPDRDSYKDEGKVDTAEFYRIIKDLFPLASSSVSSSQRRIFFRSNRVYALFLYSIAKYEGSRDFPEMDINIKNMRSLYSLVQDCEEKEIRVLKPKDKSRAMILGDNFMYSFSSSKFKLSDQMINNMENILESPVVYVDYNHLVKVVNLSSDLTNISISRLDFNYREGRIQCILKTKRSSDVDFLLRGKEEEGIEPLDKFVSIQTSLLKSLVKIFGQETVVGVSLNDDGIGVVSDRYRSVVYREGRK